MRAAPLTKAPRAPGFAYLAISAATLVLVGSLALNAEQAPPPTVAEFAPTAQEQITDAPPDQGSTTGDGPGQGEGPQRRPDADPDHRAAEPALLR